MVLDRHRLSLLKLSRIKLRLPRSRSTGNFPRPKHWFFNILIVVPFGHDLEQLCVLALGCVAMLSTLFHLDSGLCRRISLRVCKAVNERIQVAVLQIVLKLSSPQILLLLDRFWTIYKWSCKATAQNGGAYFDVSRRSIDPALRLSVYQLYGAAFARPLPGLLGILVQPSCLSHG